MRISSISLMKRKFKPYKRKNASLESWKYVLKEYCKNTSLHGFRYIVSKDSNISERIIWFLVCIFGLVFGVTLMLLIWQRFVQTPTVTTIETTTHPIFNLNFPAVTICNYNKVYKPRATEFGREMRRKGLNDTEVLNFFLSLPKLIRPDFILYDNRRAIDFLASENVTIEDIMYNMMQPCEKLLLRCAWEGKIYDCSKIFKPIKSIEGFCCAFNYHVDTSENSIFGVRASKRKVNVNPADKKNLSQQEPGVFEVLNVPGAGRDVGLSVVLDLEHDSYFGPIRPSVGASILVHDPFIYPEVEVLTSVVQPTQETAVILSGTKMESAPDVRSLDLTRRNCWFNDERTLRISSVYSYQSCITECRIRYIRNYCNCVPFYYPNYYRERICDLSDVNCHTKYRGGLSNLRSIIDLAAQNNTQDVPKCECLPSCDDNYYTSNSENAFMENVSFNSPILEGLNVKNVSLASIYFHGITCLKYRKDSWKSWDDVVASFGGIFGLCVGGSFVSLVEFFYFFLHKIFYGKSQENTPNSNNFTLGQKELKIIKIEPVKYLSELNCRIKSKKSNTPQPLKMEAHAKYNLHEEFIKHFQGQP
ncbi:hypothetical protein TKK_0005203 [Trichogramma kaykai]|uniref:Sodium channel protein Nach n=1 Tax=Trichogramma kaykai TaxID=54128 RepID=A0ABD2XJY7_9HYME